MALYVVVAFHVRFMPLCFGSEVKLLYTLLYSHLVNKGILMDVNICLFIYLFIRLFICLLLLSNLALIVDFYTTLNNLDHFLSSSF